MGFPKTIDADLLVIAGDIHDDAVVRALLVDVIERTYEIPVFIVAGNHCCHFNAVGGAYQRPELRRMGGISIGLATLWTHLDPLAVAKASGFIDFQEIVGMTPDIWNALHQAHLASLKAWQPDVIVTHHAPFIQSLSPAYADHPLNDFFINTRIDPTDFPNTKVWIHGHVHQDHDYTIEGIRVLCNPKGYWKERRPTKIEIVEI